jgi:hypothetical protein
VTADVYSGQTAPGAAGDCFDGESSDQLVFPWRLASGSRTVLDGSRADPLSPFIHRRQGMPGLLGNLLRGQSPHQFVFLWRPRAKRLVSPGTVAVQVAIEQTRQ